MVYTAQEKQRMDILLNAFQEYVDTNEMYDVLYSRKAGFLRVCMGEGADEIYFPITGFDDMLRMFVGDFLTDEAERVGHYLRRDYDHVRNLLTPILHKLGDERDYALAFMEQEFENCKLRCEQMRQERLKDIQETEKLLRDLLEDLYDAVTP